MTGRHGLTSRGLYRSRRGWVFGVCRGLGDHVGINPLWIRLVCVIAFIASGFWPVVVIYILAAVALKPEPVVPFSSSDEAEFYNSYADQRSMAVERVKRKFNDLQRRIGRIEDIVTSSEFEWEQRLQR